LSVITFQWMSPLMRVCILGDSRGVSAKKWAHLDANEIYTVGRIFTTTRFTGYLDC
jgi:hypothetical protein